MQHLDKFSHAGHNYKVSNYLDSCGESLNDWIVTTAFYSAIHYCQIGLFPGDYYVNNDKELDHYTSFENFLTSFRNSSTARTYASPHKARRWLIENQIDEIGYEYCALSDNCHIARYKNYRINDTDKNDSLEYLEEIKNFCS